MDLSDWALLSGALVLAAGLAFGFWWRLHIRFGPIYYGNARWRREAPLRATRQAEREVLAALTKDDRAWLIAHDWKP